MEDKRPAMHNNKRENLRFICLPIQKHLWGSIEAPNSHIILSLRLIINPRIALSFYQLGLIFLISVDIALHMSAVKYTLWNLLIFDQRFAKSIIDSKHVYLYNDKVKKNSQALSRSVPFLPDSDLHFKTLVQFPLFEGYEAWKCRIPSPQSDLNMITNWPGRIERHIKVRSSEHRKSYRG